MALETLLNKLGRSQTRRGYARDARSHLRERETLAASPVSGAGKAGLPKISFLPSRPASIVHPPAAVGAVSFILSIPSEFDVPRTNLLCFFQVRANLGLSPFKRFLVHSPAGVLPSTCLPDRRPLPGRQRQTGDPPPASPQSAIASDAPSPATTMK